MHMHKSRWQTAARLAGCALFAMLSAAAGAQQEQRPNVVILATGGTIAGTAATATQVAGYTAAKVPVEQLIDAVPDLKKVANVKGEQLAQVASESMTNDVWLKLAKRINVLLAQPDVDGIVITHGTDTLEETAYFLNLVVKSRKPVVLVGAMRPSTAMSADGPFNIYNGVAVAASKESAGRGVLVSLNDQINSARDVTKVNTMTLDTFRAPDFGLVGYVVGAQPSFYRASTRKHTTDTEFDITNVETLPPVDIVYGYANMNRVPLDAFVAAGDKGIIHAGVGDGSLAAQVKPALIETRKKGVIIVRSSRTGGGPVVRNGEANDDELDFVVSDTLTPQKARILLMLALTKTNNTKEIQRMFYTY